ncbi:MAG: polyprenyl synthetase family protein [Conexivisphaerales archaeon]
MGEVSGLKELQSELKRIALLVNSYLINELKGEPKELYDASAHLILAGGKRLRPFIVVKFYSMFKGNENDILPTAAAVEFIHNFTLIHDDIMDRDEYRHGVPTVHKKYGEPLAILAGDVLFAKVFAMLTKTPALRGSDVKMTEAVSSVANSLVTLCEGQALDMKMPQIGTLSEELYYSTIEKKTSALFQTSALLGCIAAGCSEKEKDNARIYARHIGLAFQLIDDLLGVAGETEVTGKPVGNDLREGKRTIPIMMAVQNAGRNEREAILHVWGNDRADNDELLRVVGIIRSMKVDTKVKELAKKHIENSLLALSQFPDCESRKYLEALAKFVIDRRM